MGYLDENDPDYHEDRRRAREDMREALREEQRYGSGYRGGRRYDDDDEDVLEWFITRGLLVAVVLFVVVAGLYFAAGWLDAQFGWGLTDWLNSWLPEFLRRKR